MRILMRMLTIEKALSLLEQGLYLSIDDIACILRKWRTDLIPSNAQRLHALLRKYGLETHRSLANYLVPMLVEVGQLHDARELFDQISYRNNYSYNSLLSGYVKYDKCPCAFTLYERMQDDSLCPSEHTFVPLLQACAKLKDGEMGWKIHNDIVTRGLENGFFVSSTMVHMYVKCGLLTTAQQVFNGLQVRDAVTWTSLITGHVKVGHSEHALKCFEEMQQGGISPNSLTFACILKAYGILGAAGKGQLMHVEVEKRGLLKTDVLVGNALIDMYAKCGFLAKAEEVFNKIPAKDIVSWNILSAGYLRQGSTNEVFECFKMMQTEGFSPDVVTFICNLTACTNIDSIEKGQHLHCEIVLRGCLAEDTSIGNALVDMYANGGFLAEAEEVFFRLQTRDIVAWTSLIGGYTKHGFGEEAINCFQKMQDGAICPDSVVYICVLKACSSIRDIEKGQEIHAEVTRLKLLEQNPNVGTSLIDMYSCCDILIYSQEVFDKLPHQDIVSWNALIGAYMNHGCSMLALNCFEQLQLEGVYPDAITFLYIMKACSNIGAMDNGQNIHTNIVKQDLLENHICLGNALVDMYIRCGLFKEAQDIFDKLPLKDTVSWNTLSMGYIKYGYFNHALKCIQKMQQLRITPDLATFLCRLKVCCSVDTMEDCHELHSEMINKGFLEKEFTFSSLVKSQEENTVLWNGVMEAYLSHGHSEETLACFERMQLEGVYLDDVTLVCGIKACIGLRALCKGQEIHRYVVEIGSERENFMVGTALINMYATGGLLLEVEDVFYKLFVRDTITWNALMSVYLKQGYNEESIESYDLMKFDRMVPDTTTYVCILNVCSNVGNIDKGREVHSEILKRGFLEESFVGNALISMYAKCGQLKEGHQTLTMVEVDTVSWNTLISGYVDNAFGCLEALECFEQMQSGGICPDLVTFLCNLKACSSLEFVNMGYRLHAEIIRRGFLEGYLIMGNALIDMYLKHGLLVEAQYVFDKLPVRDTVSWNALIAGNVNEKREEEALNCFQEMQMQSISPDVFTFVSTLRACGSTRALKKGRELHCDIMKKGFLESSLIVGNALVDMYVNWNLFCSAHSVLNWLSFRDVVSWTTIISGYIKHGWNEEALECLEEMKKEGIVSDIPLWNSLLAGYANLGHIEKVPYILEKMGEETLNPVADTFVIVLMACSHSGFLNEGQIFFDVMKNKCGIVPTLEHYTCMVDLLGRAGQLEEAKLLLEEMPFHPDTVIFHTLLGACRKWQNAILGREVFEFALRLDEKDVGAHVCMFNIYADCDVVDIERVNEIEEYNNLHVWDVSMQSKGL